MKTENLLFVGGPHKGQYEIDAGLDQIDLTQHTASHSLTTDKKTVEIPQFISCDTYYRRSVSANKRLYTVMCHASKINEPLMDVLFEELKELS